VTWQLDRSTFDPKADACTDFYQHVCGGFSTIDRLAPHQGAANWAVDLVNAANDRALQQLLAGASDASDPEVARLRTFFSSCMASDTDKTGEATLRTWMARLDAIATRDDVLRVLRELHRVGVPALFTYAGEPDLSDRTRHRGEIDRGSLGLRGGEYTETGATADARRAAYLAHVQKMFELAGVTGAAARRDAAAVFEVDRKLAATVAPPSDQWDSTSTEHPMTRAKLEALAPHLGWDAYLGMVGHAPGTTLNVISPAYLTAVDAAVATRPIAVLRAYLRWRFLSSLGTSLPARLADERYRFLALAGVQREPRAEECQLDTIKAMGVELSRQFSHRFLGPQVRERAAPIAEQVKAEIARAIPSLDWLSPEARAATAQKTREILMKVGYPDSWPATGAFALRADTFLDNVLAARAYEQQRSWTRAGAPRRRDSWENIVYPNAASGMAAARLTISNAFPDILANSIVFTAASLRAPLVDPDAPPEVSYGMFGAVAAHELVHVIEQHQFDRLGELRETWTPADVQRHDARRACVIDQANDFVAFDNVHLDGKYTYSENVADVSGVAHAYAAMARAVGPSITERGPDGFTRAQRFFVSYAQYYCQAARPEYERENLRRDPHAPPRYRVNGPLSNLPAFAAAFSCAASAPMVRPAARRCVVW
jgi:endothelin-converting enzyme/putative endopeptidase